MFPLLSFKVPVWRDKQTSKQTNKNKTKISRRIENEASIHVHRHFQKNEGKITYQARVYVLDGFHVGMVHSRDAILVRCSWGVLFINKPSVNMSFIGFHYVISFLLFTAMISIFGSFICFAVKDPMGVNCIGPVSHVLKMDLNRVSNLSFYHWTQKSELLWVGFLLCKGPICVLSIEHLLVHRGHSVCTAYGERLCLAVITRIIENENIFSTSPKCM